MHDAVARRRVADMEWELFCEEQAIACEQRAAALADRAREDWLTLADDWRLAASEPEPPYCPLPPPASRV